MTDPLSHKDKLLSSLALIFLIFSGAGTAQPGRMPEYLYAKPTAVLTSVHIASSVAGFSQEEKTGDNSSRYIHTEKNSDLVITIPDASGRNYRLVFFDGDRLLFQISVAGEPFLIMEKSNFRHAGLFRYELFKDDVLVERNNFIIKND